MEFTHYQDEDGDDCFVADDFFLRLSTGLFDGRLVLTSPQWQMWFFTRGWKHNWLTGTDDFQQEIRHDYGRVDYVLSAVTRKDGMVMFSDEDTGEGTANSMVIPPPLIKPLTEAMMKRGLVLPLPGQHDHAERGSLSSLLLGPR